MANWVLAVALVAAVSGCTRLADDPEARPAPLLAAPISELQVNDLLSDDVISGEGNLFGTVDPADCSGLAREVDPPFLVDHDPVATTGGHWEAGSGPLYIQEMVAVYPSTFNATDALDDARQTIQSCADSTLTVTTVEGNVYVFGVGPNLVTGPANSVVWSLRSAEWNCDNALVAAYNAAIEITSCGAGGGFDIASAAQDGIDRIEKLVNSTA